MHYRIPLLALCLSLPAAAPIASGAVVINEIFYNAPDEIPKLQWVELHNTGDSPVDLSGWRLVGGIEFRFPANTSIGPNGFMILCQDANRFAEFYPVPVAGEFRKSLKGRGERIDLLDSSGRRVDRVSYSSDSPWPLAADGYSASLERITPDADGTIASNWAASAGTSDQSTPGGSPGAQNAAYSRHFPPNLTHVTFTPPHPAPGQPIVVEAAVDTPGQAQAAELHYELVSPGKVSEPGVISMQAAGDRTFTGTIPPQKDQTLVRFRVRAVDLKGAERTYPSKTDLRPAVSVYVQTEPTPGAIPLAYVINTDAEDTAGAARYVDRARQGGRSPFQDEKRWQAREILNSGLDLEGAWTELTVYQELAQDTYKAARAVMLKRAAERQKISEEIESSADLPRLLEQLPDRVAQVQRGFVADIQTLLPPDRNEAFAKWVAARNQPQGPGMEPFFKNLLKIEGGWTALNRRFELTHAQLSRVGPVLQTALKGRSPANPALADLEPGPGSFQKLQAAFGQVENEMWTELRRVLSYPQKRYLESWFSDHGSFIRPRASEVRALPPRGRSAFIIVDPQTKKPEIFDFVHVTERSAGYKVRFHKDHTFRGMSTANVIFEYNDRFVLAEALAYDFYRQVGCPSPATEFVRLSLDGQPVGYHLLFEQINRSFLRRNQRNPDGDLYKLAWYGRSVESQHEKQNNPESGHGALQELLKHLAETKDAAQWRVIEQNFNVPEVINYFAVNMCLSHWDGFFNNYFAYHDRKGSGKWEMYPWDQDKTWGYYDAIKPGEVFFNMPITYGMEGDLPPGGGPAQFNPRSWWRPGGFFSKPLLANAEFRARFARRMSGILEEHFTPAVILPLIDQMHARLRPEAAIRAEALGQNPADAVQRLEANVASLKENMTKRREFLLEQTEIKQARAGL